MATVVIYIIGVLLAVFQSSYAAAYAGLAVVILAEVLRIRQHSLEELQRHNLYLYLFRRIIGQRCLVFDLVDARHAEVLDAVEISEILLSERHPEACALDGRIVDDERLYLLVVQEIAFLWADIWIVERLMDLEWFGLHPFAVFPV